MNKPLSVLNTDGISDIAPYMQQVGVAARVAARALSRASSAAKNTALIATARILMDSQNQLQNENEKDLKAGKSNGLSAAMLDRLALTPERIESMAAGLKQIATLPDPIGEISDMNFMPSGIQVGRMRVPLGVIGIIYESRPNVTADAAGLCLKSGNATVLRGGSEAIHSNLAISNCIQQGLKEAGLPADAVQVIKTIDRAAVGELITMQNYIDVIVPRGGKSLIERISKDAKVPVIKHLHGVCHVYIDQGADIDKAVAIAVNAKTQRYGTCNTMETLLLHAHSAKQLLPLLKAEYDGYEVELRGCPKTCELLPGINVATDADWGEEYLAPILSIKIVESLDQAMDHIDQYGSHHTDTIVTENYSHADRFLREVDSSSVMVNASTRFADGFEYGLGAEIGISTDKIHARGPVGLEGLTSRKYIVRGDGHVRS